MKRYQYRTLKTEISALATEELTTRLDLLGADGWRLVSTVPHEHHGYSREVHLLFIRDATEPQ